MTPTVLELTTRSGRPQRLPIFSSAPIILIGFYSKTAALRIAAEPDAQDAIFWKYAHSFLRADEAFRDRFTEQQLHILDMEARCYADEEEAKRAGALRRCLKVHARAAEGYFDNWQHIGSFQTHSEAVAFMERAAIRRTYSSLRTVHL